MQKNLEKSLIAFCITKNVPCVCSTNKISPLCKFKSWKIKKGNDLKKRKNLGEKCSFIK
jgi:hypothetical protein